MFLTFLTGVIAHALLVFAQKLIPIATIGVMQSAQPALAVLWGVIILGETVNSPQIVGMVLVVVGLGPVHLVEQAGSRAAERRRGGGVPPTRSLAGLIVLGTAT